MNGPPMKEKPKWSESSARFITNTIRKWGRQNFKPFPWRPPKSMWLALIVEIMLLRTRASSVALVYNRFATLYPSPVELARADISEVAEVLRPLGLAWRVPLIIELAGMLKSAHGKIPNTLPELIKLPGVGNYVAAAYLSFGINSRGVLIDANVVRWLCRMTGRAMTGETRRSSWIKKACEILTPRRKHREYNYAVLDFTMTVCGTNPICEICPVRSKCDYGSHPECRE